MVLSQLLSTVEKQLYLFDFIYIYREREREGERERGNLNCADPRVNDTC